MSTFGRIGSALVALSLVCAPALASATEKHTHAKHEKADKAEIKVDELKKLVDKRIEEIRAEAYKRIEAAHVKTDDLRKSVDQTMTVGEKAIHTAVDDAAKDEVVTKDEAKKIRGLLHDLRTDLDKVLPRKAKRHAKK
jgi:hypothetical protein